MVVIARSAASKQSRGKLAIVEAFAPGLLPPDLSGVAMTATASGLNAIDNPMHASPSKRRAFMREQPTLAMQAAAITGEALVRADDAMAGQDDRDRIGAVGGADGAHGFRQADFRGERAVTRRLA